jgi:hypothetical protein
MTNVKVLEIDLLNSVSFNMMTKVNNNKKVHLQRTKYVSSPKLCNLLGYLAF